MRKKAITGLFLTVFVLIISNAQATFIYYNSTIQGIYYGGDYIRGAINLSFIDEPVNSTLRSNFPGNASLINWLQNNSLLEDVDYKCSIKNCREDYLQGQKEERIILGLNENRTIGFKIIGRDINIEDFNLRLQSSGPPSCAAPLKIKIAGKTDYIVQSRGYTQNPCGEKIFGCFNNQSTLVTAQIRSRAYCANVTLPAAPSFEIGAVIKGSGQADLKMWLYNKDKDFLAKCGIITPSSQQDVLVNCIVNSSSIYQSNYFICISDETNGGAYNINLETSGNNCGSNGIDSDQYVADYQIYGRPMQFNSPDISINQTLFNLVDAYETLQGYLQDYINDLYGGNCTAGCFVPLEIQSGTQQNITLSSSLIKYSSDIGSFSSSDIYSLNKQSAKINMASKILSIDKLKFIIPLNSTENNFIFYLNNREITRKALNITPSFDFDISPKRAVIAQETEFKIIAKTNISSSSWKFFGDAEKDVQDYKIKKTFYDEGIYEIEVRAVNGSGSIAKKKFEIEVGDAKSAIESLLNSYQNNINNIYSRLDSFSSWIKIQAEKRARLNETNLTITKIRSQINGSSAGNYSRIIKEVLDLDIPESIIVEKSWQNIPLDIGAVEMDTRYIEKISNRSVADKDVLKTEILQWMNDNYNGEISTDVLSLKTKNESKVLFTIFNISIRAKNETNESYFIIDYPKEVVIFSKSYGEEQISSEEGEGIVIPLQTSNNLEFIILDEIEPLKLKAYISPDIGVIRPSAGYIEPGGNENPRKSKAYLFYIIIIVGFFVVYILLQEWYKKYYESQLFANKDDLYNIVTFIHNSRLGGLDDNKTRNKLEDSGWSREQVSFAFKKIDGKRTGMFEIPLFNFLEKKKINNEIVRRVQLNRVGGPDARFIKRV
jgi:hypothetical protein